MGLRAKPSFRKRSRWRLLLRATAVSAPSLARNALGMAPFDVRIDAREHDRDDRREQHLPQLEEQESQTAHEATAHGGTLATDVPAHATHVRRRTDEARPRPAQGPRLDPSSGRRGCPMPNARGPGTRF